jgi:hypothetical protein
VAPGFDEAAAMKVRSVVGVIVGGVVDIVATNVFGIPLVIYVMYRDHLAGAGAARALASAITSDPSIVVTMMVLGGVASVLGGYTAAWIAGRSFLVIGAFSAWFCTVFGIMSLVHDDAGTSLLQHLGGLVLSPALGLLGGYVRSLQTRRVVRA